MAEFEGGPPIETFTCGPYEVPVWENQLEHGPVYKMQLRKSYTQDGERRRTNYLDGKPREIDDMITALERSKKYVIGRLQEYRAEHPRESNTQEDPKGQDSE